MAGLIREIGRGLWAALFAGDTPPPGVDDLQLQKIQDWIRLHKLHHSQLTKALDTYQDDQGPREDQQDAQDELMALLEGLNVPQDIARGLIREDGSLNVGRALKLVQDHKGKLTPQGGEEFI